MICIKCSLLRPESIFGRIFGLRPEGVSDPSKICNNRVIITSTHNVPHYANRISHSFCQEKLRIITLLTSNSDANFENRFEKINWPSVRLGRRWLRRWRPPVRKLLLRSLLLYCYHHYCNTKYNGIDNNNDVFDTYTNTTYYMCKMFMYVCKYTVHINRVIVSISTWTFLAETKLIFCELSFSSCW